MSTSNLPIPLAQKAINSSDLESRLALVLVRRKETNFWYVLGNHSVGRGAAAISRLPTDNGLEVLATVFQTGHSFWMYSLHHAVRYEGKSRPRAGAWFDPMKSLVGLAGFTAFDLLRGFLGSKTSAMLVICRKTS